MIAAVASCRRAAAQASSIVSRRKHVAVTTTTTATARFSLRRSRPAASFFHTSSSRWDPEETAVSTHAIPPYPKQATGIVGLSVQPDWRNILTRLYNEQLAELEGIPADNEYRKSVENVCRIRLEILEREADVFKFEAEIGLGQVEELIEMAEDELRLIPNYKSWKVWELPMEVHEEDRELHEGDPRYQDRNPEMVDLEPEPVVEIEDGDEDKKQVPA